MTMTKAKLGLVLFLALVVSAEASASAQPESTEIHLKGKAATKPPASDSAKTQIALDRYGDPLPPGAMTRLGSIRLRHAGTVQSVAFAPDGKTLMSGGYDGWAFQWDVATGKSLRMIRQSTIQSVAIDHRGKTVALASYPERAVKLYELATGKELATIPDGGGGVAFSPDDKLLATWGAKGKIRLWNAATARGIDTWKADGFFVPSLRFTPDGKHLVCPDGEGALRFWDVAAGKERKPPGSLASARAYSFCFTSDGKSLLTGSMSPAGLLQLWDAISGKEIRTIARTRTTIARIVLSPDAKTVWTADANRNLYQWDMASGKQLLHLSKPLDRMHDFALSPNGERLAAGDHAGNVFLWDTKTGKLALDFKGHHGSASCAAFTLDGRQLWTGGGDSTILLWDTVSGKQVRRFSTERDNDMPYSLALSPDGKMLAAAIFRKTQKSPFTEKCDVRLWDLTTGTEREPLRGHEGWVMAVAFSPDGRTLASRSWDQTIRLWDVATGKQHPLLRCQWDAPRGISFSPDGSRVISSLDKATVGFWDVDSGRLMRRLNVKSSVYANFPLLSRDGRALIAGGGEQPLRVWEVASGKQRRSFETILTKPYSAVALSPDSRILAVWETYAQPIQMWDLRTGELLGKLHVEALPASVSSLTFSPNGRCLASTDYNGTTLIWDVARYWPASPAPAELSARRLEELWSELADEDAAKAYGALRTLAAAPEQSLPLLRQRLAEAAKVKVDSERIARLLAELDSAEFEAREKATKDLQELGFVAEATLRRALRERPALEVRHRVEALLDKLESGAKTLDQLRILRAVEVLEIIGSAQARPVLRELTRGPADSWLTQEAKGSLARLEAQTRARP
ncbi:MAG: hypothetical protein ACYC3I_12420 [Gemmataceae bacterium]